MPATAALVPLRKEDVRRLRVGDRLAWKDTPYLTGQVAEVDPDGETAAILVYCEERLDDVLLLRACDYSNWDDDGNSVTWMRSAGLPQSVQQMLDDAHAKNSRRLAALWQTAETYGFSTDALENGALNAVIEMALGVTCAQADQAPADVITEEIRRLRIALEGAAR